MQFWQCYNNKKSFILVKFCTCDLPYVIWYCKKTTSVFNFVQKYSTSFVPCWFIKETFAEELKASYFKKDTSTEDAMAGSPRLKFVNLTNNEDYCFLFNHVWYIWNTLLGWNMASLHDTTKSIMHYLLQQLGYSINAISEVSIGHIVFVFCCLSSWLVAQSQTLNVGQHALQRTTFGDPPITFVCCIVRAWL